MPTHRPSQALLDEYFDRGDPRFMELLRQTASPKLLAGLAERWKSDPRFWARETLREYLSLPWNCPGHQPLLRRFFKHAERTRDDELMADFLVGFDRLVRRVRRRRWQWNSFTGQTTSEEVLALPRNKLPNGFSGRLRSPLTGQQIRVPRKFQDRRPFTYRTRYYLRRRVWRYFRQMAWQRPERFVPTLCKALAAYRDEDLSRGENVLDSRSLMIACFRRHPSLEFGTAKVRLRPDRSLSELTPAPCFRELWSSTSAAAHLITLLYDARSRLVRIWAMELLKSDHRAALAKLPLATLFHLLNNADAEVQEFAAELLDSSAELRDLPAAEWLPLLRTENLTALEVICRLMKAHIDAATLTSENLVELATAKPSPVARLGLHFLATRAWDRPEDREALQKLSSARCESTGAAIALFALKHFQTGDQYDRDAVQWFFDSPLASMRQAAWAWLAPSTSAYRDPVLWSRLLETPYDDLRLPIIDALDRRTSESPRPSDADLAPVWCAVLAGVHRGGRQKRKAVWQLTDAIARRPETINELLPVLAVAIRSVRKPEAREALAALMALVEKAPHLERQVLDVLPELRVETV